MNKTGIEYLDFSWNPIAMRCTPVSPGCANCWHIRTADKMMKNPLLPQDARDAHAGDIGPVLIEYRLDEPLRKKKGAVIGVQFMGDLFHKNIPDDYIIETFVKMGEAPQHTFLVLTKRPKRMAEFIGKSTWGSSPLHNLWLGVSISTQDETWKVAELLKIPASVRFVSVEPMLEGIKFKKGWLRKGCQKASGEYAYHPLHWVEHPVNLVICGAETGPGKRPMKLDWARNLRGQCQAAGVPFFFKCDSDGNRELDGRLWEEMVR